MVALKSVQKIGLWGILLGWLWLGTSCVSESDSQPETVGLAVRVQATAVDSVTFASTQMVRAVLRYGARSDSQMVPFAQRQCRFMAIPVNTSYTLELTGLAADGKTALWQGSRTGVVNPNYNVNSYSAGTVQVIVPIATVTNTSPNIGQFETGFGRSTNVWPLNQMVEFYGWVSDSQGITEVRLEAINSASAVIRTFSTPAVTGKMFRFGGTEAYRLVANNDGTWGTGASVSIRLTVRNSRGLESSKTLWFYRVESNATMATQADVALSSLWVVGHTFRSMFQPEGLEYTTDTVGREVSSVSIQAMPRASIATVTCDNGPCSTVSLMGGTWNSILVRVTNGVAFRTYTVHVPRATAMTTMRSTDTALQRLQMDASMLYPGFSPQQLNYWTDSLPSTLMSTPLNVVARSSTATVFCTPGPCTSIPLAGGSNWVQIQVDNNGAKLVYRLEIRRRMGTTLTP